MGMSPNVSWTPWRRAGGCGGGLHAAGSLRIVRHGSGGFNQRPGPPLRPPKEAGDIVSSARLLTKVHAPNVEMDTERRAGGSKGELHAAGSGRMARHGSGGPSQRPAPPRRAQKGAGDIVSSAGLLTKVHAPT